MKTFCIIMLVLIAVFSSVNAMSSAPPPPPPFKSAEITGPLHRAPLFLADTISYTLIVNISSSTPKSIYGNIAVDGTTVEEPYSRNLAWEISNTVLNAGFDARFWRSVSLFGNLTISDEEISGGDFGIGLTVSSLTKFRVRLDLGLFKQNMNAEAYGYEKGGQFDYSPFISIVLNTAFENSSLEPFLQTSYSRQFLFDFRGYSRDVSGTISLFTFTPGINYRLFNNFSLMAGANIFIPSALKSRSTALIIAGFAQCNLLL